MGKGAAPDLHLPVPEGPRAPTLTRPFRSNISRAHEAGVGTGCYYPHSAEQVRRWRV